MKMASDRKALIGWYRLPAKQTAREVVRFGLILPLPLLTTDPVVGTDVLFLFCGLLLAFLF